MDQIQPARTGGSTEEALQDKASEVGQTAKEHTRQLGDEVARQARDVTGQVRERLTGEAQSQNERLAMTLRHLSGELEMMHKNAPGDSMAAAMVQRLSEGSRQAADYLREHGPEGVLNEVKEYARRKPGTFLLTSAVAGFVVGRIGKGLLTSGNGNGSGTSADYDPGKPSSTTYRSSTAAPQQRSAATPQPPYTTGTAPMPTPDRDLP